MRKEDVWIKLLNLDGPKYIEVMYGSIKSVKTDERNTGWNIVKFYPNTKFKFPNRSSRENLMVWFTVTSMTEIENQVNNSLFTNKVKDIIND